MNGKTVGLRLLATGALLLTAACQDATTPTAPAAPETATTRQALQTPDIAMLARTVPGFGGFYYDDGMPTVYLTDTGRRATAAAAAALGLAASELRVLRGQYGYRQLERWFRQVSAEALAIPGAVFADLDEAANRVLVGVEHGTAGAAVRGVAARLGVPPEAMVVREVEPIRLAATLRDRVRPVVGGLQIHFSIFLCTLGFNAGHAAGASFITNSHCTERQGGTEGTIYFQPVSSIDPVPIGTEMDDPVYFRGGECPRGRRCRFSDASRAAYAAGVDFTLGGIARTTGPNNRSIEIAGEFEIAGEGDAAVGQVANKVGRTTGWTQGPVTNTCVTTNVFGTNITQLCQTFVSAGVGAGDSGSPVFAARGGSRVTLLGILWGGSGSSPYAYSPIANIERELGALTTH